MEQVLLDQTAWTVVINIAHFLSVGALSGTGTMLYYARRGRCLAATATALLECRCRRNGTKRELRVVARSGYGPTAIWQSLRDGLAKTLRFNWCFWPIIQLAIYGFVPVRHRLMSVMLFNFLWSIILSR